MASQLAVCCRKSVKIALVVGTVLSGVNQGSVIIRRTAGAVDLLRIVFNYLVPLFVATYARLALIKELKQRGLREGP